MALVFRFCRPGQGRMRSRQRSSRNCGLRGTGGIEACRWYLWESSRPRLRAHFIALFSSIACGSRKWHPREWGETEELIPYWRQNFNEQFSEVKYAAFLRTLEGMTGDSINFRPCETPVFLPLDLKAELEQSSL